MPEALCQSGRHDERLPGLIERCLQSPADSETARLTDLFLDASGLAHLGASTEVVKKVAKVVRGSTLSGSAYLNGTSIHALDFDDTHEPSLCHTGAAIIPGIFSIANSRNKSGRELLNAFSAGIEFVGLLAPMGPRLNERGFHSTAILGAMGAAVACSVLTGASRTLIAGATEVAASMAAGLCASFGTETKPLQAGHAAEVGLRSALLVEQGLIHPSDALLGDKGLLRLVLGEGAVEIDQARDQRSAVWDVAVKAYPSCYLSHGTIDAARQARSAAGVLSAQQVKSASVAVSPLAAELANKSIVESELDAKFSIRYCLLAGLVADNVDVGVFADSGRADVLAQVPEWLDWLSRVEVVADDNLLKLETRVDVVTTSGEQASFTVDSPWGSITKPLSSHEIRDKLATNLNAVQDRRATDDLVSNVRAIPDCADISTLGALLPFDARG